MSLNRSLKKKIKFGRNNVLTRIEKIKHLIKVGKWKEGDTVLNLPKIKILKSKKLKKEKKVIEVTPLIEKP